MTAHAIWELPRDALPRLLAAIDRTEHVDIEYVVVEGALDARPVTGAKAEVPPWDAEKVAEMIGFAESVVDDHGGIVLGARVDDEVAGLVVIAPTFEPGLAWFALLHVSSARRRTGVASALWAASVDLARGSRAERLYVSATPTGSAVGFYLSRGCRLADPVHPALFAKEPEDIHLVLDL